MGRFEPGDRVKIDIPEGSDLDFEQFHGRVAEVIDVLKDDVGRETRDERDLYLFTVKFDDGSKHGCR